MARKPMQDIVPKGRSIREVTRGTTRDVVTAREATRIITPDRLPEKKPRREVIIDKEESETIIETTPEEVERREMLRQAREEFEEKRAKKSKKTTSRFKGLSFGGSWFASIWSNHKKPIIISGSIIGAIAAAIIFTSIFKSALITITPRTSAFTANADFTAKKVAGANELPYQLITIESTGSQTVKASGQKQVSTRASGTIVIYNNYNSTSQRLIKNTRFATPEGLIFRISESVTVPGKKGTTPGSVEAVVMADEPGDEYNVGLKDFTIPGFKGDPRYAGFYARAKTPMSGGFVGIQKIVADADRAKAKTTIEAKLREDLVKEVLAKKTADQIFYMNAYTIDFTALPDEAVGSSEANLRHKGTINAVVFDRKQFASELAREYVKDYKGDSVIVPADASLKLEFKDFKPATANSITFKVSGPASFEWVYDEEALKLALKGQSKSSTQAIFKKFPMILNANISLSPFWMSSFPDNVEKITIKKNI